MTIPIDIRAALRTDVPAIVALVTNVLGEFGLEFGSGATTDEQLRDLPDSYAAFGGAFWVATDDRIVGMCGVFPIAPATFELRKMYLHPAARGRRLGARLLDVAIEWTRAHGGARIVLDTIEEMTRAIAFYEANGFVRDDCQIRGSRCTRGYSRTV